MYSVFKYQELKDFCEKIFSCYGFSAQDSHTITDVLLRADLWGIESHGMQRMIRYHREITSGMVSVGAVPEVVHETPVSAVIDANKCIGQTVAVQAMRLTIEKAKKSGVGMVSVRNSNHYGIAGYYADMAVREDMAGISMTNSEAIAVPLFGRHAMLGTNPIAVGFPADPVNFIYDASTSVVTRGKVEVFNKLEKPLPDGWAVDAKGHVTHDASEVLHNIINKLGGGIAPLGGTSEMYGGHKGYGFAAIVDIFTAILSSGMTSNYVATKPGENNICHYFMAIDYGVFGDKNSIKASLSQFLRELRESPKCEGEPRIYTHGEKEYESAREKLEKGIPVIDKTETEIRKIAEHHKVPFTLVGEPCKN